MTKKNAKLGNGPLDTNCLLRTAFFFAFQIISAGHIFNRNLSRITNDDREEEMEENMQQVSTMIGNLRNMAADMGTEVENQNRQLDRIAVKVIKKATKIQIF